MMADMSAYAGHAFPRWLTNLQYIADIHDILRFEKRRNAISQNTDIMLALIDVWRYKAMGMQQYSFDSRPPCFNEIIRALLMLRDGFRD